MTIKLKPSPIHKRSKDEVIITDPNTWSPTKTEGESPTETELAHDRKLSSHVIYVTSQVLDDPDESNFDSPNLSTSTGTDDHDVSGHAVDNDRQTGSDVSNASQYTTDSEEEAAAHGKAFCWGLCCVQGCIWGVLGMIYFFVFLPSGFLLILYGTNKSIVWAVVTGSALLVLATCGFPSLCIFIRWHRKKKRDRKEAYKVERNKKLAQQTYDNPTHSPEEVV